MFYSMNDKQNAYLDSLICERLHASKENRNLIGWFYNETNDGLVADLHRGWNADPKNETAYYVIKDPRTHMILLYFSLRCGSLHTPNPYQRYQAELKRVEALYDAARGVKDSRKWALEHLAKLKENGAQSSNYIAEYAKQRDRLKAMLKALKKDKTYAAEQMDIQTFENFSGVEMVHFCKNDLAQPIWDASPLVNQSMGETLFWYFILPIVQKLTQVVGCQYLYLFAADSSKEESLVGYYQYTLHFEIREDLSFRKPAYDVCCLPMCRKLKDLEPYRKDFFQNFNRPKPPKKAENEE